MSYIKSFCLQLEIQHNIPSRLYKKLKTFPTKNESLMPAYNMS